MTTIELQTLLDARFGGVLRAGKHKCNGECCALELLSVAREIKWTDSPRDVRCWDLRSLNDIPVPDDVRTKHLLPVLAAYDGSMDWPAERQKLVASRIAIAIVREIICNLPSLPATVREQCRAAAAARSARSAAWSAESAAESDVFILACGIFMKAAQETGETWRKQ